MEFHCDPETDSLDIGFNAAPSAATQELSEGVTVDLDAQGRVVGFDIDQASTVPKRTTREINGLPFHSTKAA